MYSQELKGLELERGGRIQVMSSICPVILGTLAPFKFPFLYA